MASIPAASSIAWASAAAVAGGAYLNAKFHIGTDLKQLRYDREWGARLGKRLQEAGTNCTLYGMLDIVDPGAEALWFEGRTWTYGQLKSEVNRFARILADNGVVAGDFVAVYATNSPEMIIAVIAVARLGAIAPMMNANLRGETLTYCLGVSKAKWIVSTPDLSPFVTGDLPHISLNVSSFDSAVSNTQSTSSIQKVDLRDASYPELVGSVPPRRPADLSVLIFTSGTTGKPKACGIRNHQNFVTSNPLSQDLHRPEKYFPLRTYSALPLFHGTGFFAGLCYSLGTTSTLCLTRKFSASNFFKEIHESRATRMLYIGELCRYLLSTPPSPYDKGHACITAAGNGLRREIWNEFKERFGIPEIREFYRSTEGLGKFDNFGTGLWGAGKIGFAGPIRRALEGDTFLVRVDAETGEPVRDPKTGFCIRAKLDEAGEVIGRVKNRALLSEYLGNEAATEAKLLKDVFKKGDCFQRMGDLVVHEPTGWVRFHDRVGDSFRWKGENVSVGEVRDLICELDNVQDAIVFGVRLASYDGQAGAAVISLKNRSSVDKNKFLQALYSDLRKKGLPTYACPRLVRLTESIGTGVTFKQGKLDEAKKPWAPHEYSSSNSETVHWLDGTLYKTLDGGAWSSIETGKARL